MLKIKAARQMFFLMTVVQGLFCMEGGFQLSSSLGFEVSTAR